MTASYSMPVAKLLTLGDPRNERKWRDYLALGIKSEHVPDLIRMMQDEELRWADSESKEVWANLHAWRALGQLRAESAIEPLLGLLRDMDEYDDWTGEEVPRVLAMIGVSAIPWLTKFISESSHGMWAREAAAKALKEIAERYPKSRDECKSIIARQLEQFATQGPTLNAFFMTYLLDLKAIEYATVMESAFTAAKVDLAVNGDWEDVQIELGLLKKRKTPRPNYVLEKFFGERDLPDTIEPPRDEAVDAAIWRLEMDGILKPKSERQKKKK